MENHRTVVHAASSLKFVWGIYPNRFAKNIDMFCVKNLGVCKKTFMAMYNKYFKVRNTLKGAGGMEGVEVLVGSSTLGRSSTVMTPTKSVTAVTQAHLHHIITCCSNWCKPCTRDRVLGCTKTYCFRNSDLRVERNQRLVIVEPT